MATPTLEQTRAAGLSLSAMPQSKFDERRHAEAGDALVAFFVILAKKLFPKATEAQTAQRVELMLAAYFLRGDLEKKKLAAPAEAKAKKAVESVATLSGAALEQRMTAEVGDSVLAFLNAFSIKVTQARDDATRAGNVHLMLLAYLVRGALSAVRA